MAVQKKTIRSLSQLPSSKQLLSLSSLKFPHRQFMPLDVYRQIIAASPEPIIITNAKSEILFVNKAWERFTGYALHEVRGKLPGIVSSRKTPPAVFQKLQKALARGASYTTDEIVNKRKDGTEYAASATFFPVKTTSGTYYIQFQRDITQQKRTSANQKIAFQVNELLISSESVQAVAAQILQVIGDGIGWDVGEFWMVDEASKLQHIDEWYSQAIDKRSMTGIRKSLNLRSGKGLPGEALKEKRPIWMNDIAEEAIYGGKELAMTVGVHAAFAIPIRGNEEIAAVLVFYNRRVLNPDELLLKTLFYIGYQIGQFIEHIRTEDTLHYLNRRMELILNAAGEGIYGINEKAEITFINAVAASMFGRSERSLLGKDIHTLMHHTRPDGASYHDDECPVYMVLREKRMIRVTSELFWREDRTNFPVAYVATPIVEGDTLKGAVVLFRDITQQKRVEDLKREFLSVATHELKTPITTLKLFSQARLRKFEKTGTVTVTKEDLEFIDREMDRLTRILNDVLDDQRIETEKLHLRFQVTDIAAMIESVASQMGDYSSTHQIRCQVRKSLHAEIDEDRIRQVLINLLTNAVKYSPENTTITITGKKRGNMVEIAVADHGKGIPKEKQERIFDRFYQLQEHGPVGFGLGLYISRQIIERHGGAITVASEVGKGSTFTIHLPVKQEDMRVQMANS